MWVLQDELEDTDKKKTWSYKVVLSQVNTLLNLHQRLLWHSACMSHQHNEHNVAPSTLHHLYVQPASRCQVLPWLFNANNISFPILRPGLPTHRFTPSHPPTLSLLPNTCARARARGVRPGQPAARVVVARSSLTHCPPVGSTPSVCTICWAV